MGLRVNAKYLPLPLLLLFSSSTLFFVLSFLISPVLIPQPLFFRTPSTTHSPPLSSRILSAVLKFWSSQILYPFEPFSSSPSSSPSHLPHLCFLLLCFFLIFISTHFPFIIQLSSPPTLSFTSPSSPTPHC